MPRRPRRRLAGARAVWRKGETGSSRGGMARLALAAALAPHHLLAMQVSEAAIRALVERFYATARRDALLGPVFARAVGTEDADWVEHLDRISDFWSSAALRSGRYQGDPFSVHLRLPELTPAMFTRWLALWGEACEAQFPPESAPGIAQAFRDRAARIAQSLQLGLFDRPGRQSMPSTSAIE